MNVYEYLKNNFELFTKEDYRSCNLSTKSKRILCDIGLPEKPLNFIQFNIRAIKNIKLEDEYFIIGNDYGTNICINQKDEIVSVDPEHEYPTRFINQNLEYLLKFIVVFLSYEKVIINTSDEDVHNVIENVKREFEEIDIQALSDEENWWSVILEQIELGLM